MRESKREQEQKWLHISRLGGILQSKMISELKKAEKAS